MFLKRVEISNLRMFENVEIEFSSFTIILGANNSGKTTLIRTLEKLIGAKYPGFNLFEEEEFRKASDPIQIRLVFNDFSDADKAHFVGNIHTNSNTSELELQLEYQQILTEDNPTWRFLYPDGKAVGLVEPKHLRYLFFYSLDAVRGPHDQLRPQKTGMFNELIKTIKLSSDEAERIQEAVSNVNQQLESIAKLDELRQVLDDQITNNLPTPNRLSFSFSTQEPRKLLRNIMIYLDEFERKDSIFEYGSGYQNILAISMFFSLVSMSPEKQAIFIGIEEPETHMHPQLLRNLLRYLKNQSKDYQTIVTTHSPLVVRDSNAFDIVVLRRSNQSHANQLPKSSQDFFIEKLYKKVTTEFCEAMFSTGVVLVEGFSDRILYQGIWDKFYADKIHKTVYFFSGGGIATSMGASVIPKVAKALKSFDAQIFFLLDKDEAGITAFKKLNEEDLLLNIPQSLSDNQITSNVNNQDNINVFFGTPLEKLMYNTNDSLVEAAIKKNPNQTLVNNFTQDIADPSKSKQDIKSSFVKYMKKDKILLALNFIDEVQNKIDIEGELIDILDKVAEWICNIN